MSPLALALAALFGAMLSAPVAVLAWPRIRQHAPFALWLFRVFVLRHGSHARPMSRPRVQLASHGAHATPRGGTPTITAAQITATPTPLELTA